MPPRAVTPVVGVVCLLAVTVALAGAVGLAAVVVSPADPPPSAALSLDADAGADRVVLTHIGGDPLDVGSVRLRVSVDGQRLTHQPPVPFFAARGFEAGPTGPFNSAADRPWRPGERASLTVAATNAPTIDPGDRVVVDVYAEGHRIARLTTVAA